MRVKTLAILCIPVLVLAYHLTALAEAPEVQSGVKDVVKEADKKDAKQADGWKLTFLPSTSLMFNDNRDVVGVQTGYSLTWTGKLDFKTDYFKGKHEWRNGILWLEGLSRSPALPDFYLSADDLVINSIYLYHALQWVGVYGRAVFETDVFDGFDNQSKPTTYSIDGVVDPTLRTQYKLHNCFEPLTLKEGLGAFFRPVTSEAFNFEILLGFAFRQMPSDGFLTNKDDPDTAGVVELVRVRYFNNIGGENTYHVWGDLWEKKINYTAGVDLMLPFYGNPDNSTLDTIDKLYVQMGTRWAFRIFKWMSIDYELKVVRDKLMTADWQIQNNLMFNLGYALEKFIPG